MLKAVVVSLACGLFAVTSASAQPQGAPGKPLQADPKVLVLARRYLEETHYLQRLRASYAQMIRVWPSTCRTTECSDALVAAAGRAVAALEPDYEDQVVELWARTYSEKELTDALAFLDSPSGRSILAKGEAILPIAASMAADFDMQLYQHLAADFCAAAASRLRSSSASQGYAPAVLDDCRQSAAKPRRWRSRP